MSTYSDFIRTPEEQVRYDKDLEQFKKEWKSVSDRVKHRVFKLDFEVDDNEKKFVPSKNIPKEEFAKITINNYPYHFEQNVRHYVLWKLNGKITKQDIANGIKELRKNYEILDWTFWINPHYRKSIPEIEHAHVVVLL